MPASRERRSRGVSTRSGCSSASPPSVCPCSRPSSPGQRPSRRSGSRPPSSSACSAREAARCRGLGEGSAENGLPRRRSRRYSLGLPVVLVHGVPDAHRLWDRMRGHLSRTDVLAPDLPGFGAESPPGWTATKEAYVEWLIGQLERVGEPIDLVGHDWGSLLVQRAVSLRPDLI